MDDTLPQPYSIDELSALQPEQADPIRILYTFGLVSAETPEAAAELVRICVGNSDLMRAGLAWLAREAQNSKSMWDEFFPSVFQDEMLLWAQDKAPGEPQWAYKRINATEVITELLPNFPHHFATEWFADAPHRLLNYLSTLLSEAPEIEHTYEPLQLLTHGATVELYLRHYDDYQNAFTVMHQLLRGELVENLKEGERKDAGLLHGAANLVARAQRELAKLKVSANLAKTHTSKVRVNKILQRDNWPSG